MCVLIRESGWLQVILKKKTEKRNSFWYLLVLSPMTKVALLGTWSDIVAVAADIPQFVCEVLQSVGWKERKAKNTLNRNFVIGFNGQLATFTV